MFAGKLGDLAERVLAEYRSLGLRLGVAESCTGGLIVGCLTSVAGSSDVVDRGFVTYTNQSKCDMVGVPAALIDAHGAVSEEVARAMAEGVLDHSRAEVGLSATGIAGPAGGTEAKPVGLVHIAAARRGHPTRHERYVFAGNRGQVRLSTVEAILVLALALARLEAS